jgi:hypothetical protein
MKKNKSTLFCLLLFSAGLFTACQKQPPLQNLSNNPVILTKYDTSVDFGSYKTFFLSDTISLCTSNPIESSWSDSNAQSILREVASQMKAAGYTRVSGSPDSSADLNLKLVGILNVNVYYQSPDYWWGYPGYPNFYYWGNSNWYPYPYTYTIRTGSMILEMADLKNVDKNKGLRVVWNAVGSGLIGYSNSFIVSQCIAGVDQAFVQSPYLKTN